VIALLCHFRHHSSHLLNVQVAIPSYLLALAVGELESRRIGPRSHVWSEPSVVEAAEYEFQNTDKYLQTGGHTSFR